MTPGATERWRIINATADRYLRLGLDGHRFTVVGTDGGLLGQPLPGLTEWLLAPAQRVEIVVTIAAQQSTRYALRDLGYAGGMIGGAGGELMTVETGRGARAGAGRNCRRCCGRLPISVPRPRGSRSCFPLAGMGMMGPFLINGRTFDMNRVDLETVVGRVELWDLVNTTFMDHPIHIHGTQFQVVARTVRGRRRSSCLSGVARHRERAGGRNGHDQDAADIAGQANVPLPHPAARGRRDDGRAGRAGRRDATNRRIAKTDSALAIDRHRLTAGLRTCRVITHGERRISP